MSARTPPAQLRKFTNLREQFSSEVKALKRLRVLALHMRVTSWVLDAKNLSRIYIRMLNAEAVTPRLVPLLRKWAKHLTYYSEAYGFLDPNTYLVKGKPSEVMRNCWLMSILLEVSQLGTEDSIYPVNHTKSFTLAEREQGKYAEENTICAVSHRPLSDFKTYVRYRTSFTDGSQALSKFVGDRVFLWLEERIRNGLERHRTAAMRRDLHDRIWKHHAKRHTASATAVRHKRRN